MSGSVWMFSDQIDDEDILLGIIWRMTGGRFAAPLHRVAPTPRTALSA